MLAKQERYKKKRILPPFDEDFKNISQSLIPLYENKELFGDQSNANVQPNENSKSEPIEIEQTDSQSSEQIENNHLNQVLSFKKEECDSKFVGINNFKSTESWLEDSNRVRKFEEAINMNKYLFRNKLILDINSPYGLYGIFALKNGARYVIIRVKKGLKVFVERIFKQNGFSPEQYSLIEKPLTEVSKNWNTSNNQLKMILENSKIDCILGEWQGTLLINSEIIRELITTRDQFLKQDGLIFPRRGKIVINFIQDSAFYNSRFDFWNNVYDFNMRHVKDIVYTEPCFDYSTKDMIKTWDSVLKKFGTQNFFI